MMITGLLFLGALAKNEDLIKELQEICYNPRTQEPPSEESLNYTAIPEESWYFGTDWRTKIANQGEDDEPIYPAGFRSEELGWYNEPAVCGYVPGSSSKKVEVMIEADQDNARLCIHDASDRSIALNDVGSIDNCGNGKIYACFTAATVAKENAGDDFGFYIYCDEGCEQMDMTVYIRVRISDRSWKEGKSDTEHDLEHWCEAERGTEYTGTADHQEGQLKYVYPSDLIEDKPSRYPFHIQHIFGRSSASLASPRAWLMATLLAAAGFVWA